MVRKSLLGASIGCDRINLVSKSGNIVASDILLGKLSWELRLNIKEYVIENFVL